MLVVGAALIAASGAVIAQQERYVGPRCEGDPPPGLFDAPFDRPALRSLWEARQALLAWEAQPNVSALLDELDRHRHAAQVYFQTLEAVTIYHRDPNLGGQSKDSRRFILDNVEKFKQNRGAPQAWLDTAVKLVGTDTEKRIPQFLLANAGASADMSNASPALPGKKPLVDELTALAERAHTLWTVACSTPIRVLSSRTQAPLPARFLFDPERNAQKALFEDTAAQELVKMHQQGASTLIDHLAVFAGAPPWTPRLVWPGLHTLITQSITAAEPKILSEIAGMSEPQLRQFRDQLRKGVFSGQPVLRALSRPSVDKAMLARYSVLAGLAPEPSSLPFGERARLNLPPSEEDLLDLVTRISMDYTRQLNPGMKFNRAGKDSYDDHGAALGGERQTGTTKVLVTGATCKPVPKGHRCSLSMNLYRTRILFGGLEQSNAMPSDEQTGVVHWGSNGLESADFGRSAVGWARVRTRGSSGSSGSNGSTDRDQEILQQGLSDRADAAAARDRERRENYEADQRERRDRSRSCGPAPNICN